MWENIFKEIFFIFLFGLWKKEFISQLIFSHLGSKRFGLWSQGPIVFGVCHGYGISSTTKFLHFFSWKSIFSKLLIFSFQITGYKHHRQSNFLQRLWTFIWCSIILWTWIHFADFWYYDFLICRFICTKFLIGRNCYLFCGKGK